jgi:hypothetical protein
MLSSRKIKENYEHDVKVILSFRIKTNLGNKSSLLLYICGLFNDVISGSYYVYIASDARYSWIIVKDVEGNGGGLI